MHDMAVIYDDFTEFRPGNFFSSSNRVAWGNFCSNTYRRLIYMHAASRHDSVTLAQPAQILCSL